MPAQVIGPAGLAIQMYEAFYGAAPANAAFVNYAQLAGAAAPYTLAFSLGEQFAATPAGSLASQVLSNLGLTTLALSSATYDTLLAALTEAFTAYSGAQRGAVVQNIVTLLAGLESNAAYGTAAKFFNQRVDAGFTYASNPANTQALALANIAVSLPLTANAGDVLTGTSGNDTFDGTLAGALVTNTSQQTLQTGDSIDGGAGTDTLKLAFNYGGAGGQSIKPAALASIEAISIVRTESASTTLDLANASGLATVSLSNTQAGGDVVLDNLGSLLTGVNLATTQAGLTVNSLAATVAGTADTVAVSLALTSGSTQLSLGGYEVINLASTGAAANVLGLNHSAGATVNVTGSTSLTLSDSTSNSLTLNASGLSGAAGLTAIFAGTNDVSVTGSANADSVNFGAGYTSADTYNGGAGVDTVGVIDALAAGISASQTNLSNIEVLSIQSAASTSTYTPLAFGGATTLTLAAASVGAGITANFGNGTSGLNLSDSNSQAAGVTGFIRANSSGFSVGDVLNLAVGTASTAGLSESPVTTSGFETVELQLAGASGATHTLGNALYAAAGVNTSFVMTASPAIELLRISGSASLVASGAVAADVVDASALTGSLNLQAPSLSAAIVGGAAAFNAGVQITGGSGDDTLWGSAGADVINGGAGNDRIVLSAAGVANQADILMGGAGVDQFRFQGSTQANLLTQSSGTAQVVKIADFSAGTDKIALIGGGFNAAALGTVQTVGSAATLTDVWNAINPIAASTATNASMVIVSVLAGTAAGTYLYVNDGVAGVSSAADMLIDMTGLAGTLSTQDFVFT